MDGDIDAVLETFSMLGPALRETRATPADATVVELGFGRTPDMCAAMALLGAESAHGFDVSVRLREDWTAPDRFTALAQRLADASDLDGLVNLRSDLLHARRKPFERDGWPIRFGRYSGRRIPMPDASVDLLFSKSVLEHVRLKDVDPLMSEIRRVLRPSGIAANVIDLRDHMWIEGNGVSGDWLDCLSYSDRVFEAMFSNRSNSINRLRAPEWRARLARAGLAVGHWSERHYPLPEGFDPARCREPWQSLDPGALSVGYLTVAATPSEESGA
jgi:SAM-dependent methyltransferase